MLPCEHLQQADCSFEIGTSGCCLLHRFELCAAGAGAEANQLVACYTTTMAAAAEQLQQAAALGNHAAFAAATAAAARYPSLQDSVASCAAVFGGRRQAAEQALAAAVSALPLAQVQGAVDVALQLGTPGKQLAAAIEAARARDAEAAARLAAVMKAAGAAVQLACELAAGGRPCSSGNDGQQQQEPANSTVPAPPHDCGSCGGSNAVIGTQEAEGEAGQQRCYFDIAECEAAIATCQQLGISCNAAAASRALAQQRQIVAAQLETAAQHSEYAAVVRQLMQIGRSFGGLEQQIAAAAAQVQRRQDQLAQRLQHDLGLDCADASAAAFATSSVENGAAMHVATVSHADATAMLQQARQLDVSPGVLAEAEQHLEAVRQHALVQLQQAADNGSLAEMRPALEVAKRHCVGQHEVLLCQQRMQQRRTDAVAELAAAAAECCRAAADGAAAHKDSTVLQAMLNCTQQVRRACTCQAAEGGNSSISSNSATKVAAQLPASLGSTTHAQHSETAPDSEHVLCKACNQIGNSGQTSAAREMVLRVQEHLRQRVHCCLQLGLASNVAAALQAVETACKLALHEGESTRHQHAASLGLMGL